ncbi:hypothetical protein ACOMHN_020422 [Nucella lapillus]
MEEPPEECAVCSMQLTPPYVRCRQCVQDVHICLPCFACGAEVGAHQNDHPYTIVRDDFPVFEPQWTAAEELTLLSSLETMGYGNWSDISIQFSGKSPEECQRHYDKCYITNPVSSLPKFPEYEPYFAPAPVLFKLSDNPPRPPEGSPLCVEMGGYSAPRGDFTVEHDNFAELDICTITCEDNDRRAEEEDEEDVELMKEMKMAMVHSYHQKLKERHRRKRILKDYGLINMGSVMNYYQCGGKDQRDLLHTVRSLQVFTPLMTPLRADLLKEALTCTADMLEEALTYEQELKSRIRDLQELRRNGLTRHHSGSMYKVLRERRNTARQRRHLLSDVINHIRGESVCQSWLQLQGVSDGSKKIIHLSGRPRRQCHPLSIEGMPGYDKLQPEEKELCEVNRLPPKAYLEYSAILVTEARKYGGLRLAQARPLIKIDVNKTRKIFDYLVQIGKIVKLS